MYIHAAVRSQYRAAAEMLRQAVVRCPDSLWDDPQYKNRFWHVAYHALVYLDIYLQTSPDAFHPWEKHRDSCRHLDRTPVGAPYTREEILAYHAICLQQVDLRVPNLDLEAPSGFHWLPFSTLELQLYNIRHLQQHVGELCERLGVTAGVDVDWTGMQHDE